MTETFDYIIVGAGSAGCVLANRLSEKPETRVLLLEFGGHDNNIFIQMPTALSIPMNTKKYNWGFASEAEPGLSGRRLDCPRGKVLGGSSSINGMVYVRGNARDFDEWRDLGAHGWGYDDCLPYFIKAETSMHGADHYRGGSGPLYTSNGNGMKNPLYGAFIDAGKQAGYPVTSDPNGKSQDGFGPMDMTVKNGVRCSTANAYLKGVRQRKNLKVVTHAMVNRINIVGGRATGVDYSVKGKPFNAQINSEVIVSAGAIGSPQLLQLSGIGPGDVLKNTGVDVIKDAPGVGANLQDHLEIYFQFKCKQKITLNGQLDWFHKALIGLRWMMFKTGLGATNHFESGAFIKSHADLQWPDIQYHFLPAAMRYDGRAAFKGHGYQVHVGPNKPKSRGRVNILSDKASDKPSILFNYLTVDDDIQAFRSAIKLTRTIMRQPSFDDYNEGEIQPGLTVQSDQQIDDWIQNNVESAYHPSCTCKMGAVDDHLAVLDARCRVKGIDGLRVVDASIFPSIPNGNLNAPTIMVAEKAADMIIKNG